MRTLYDIHRASLERRACDAMRARVRSAPAGVARSFDNDTLVASESAFPVRGLRSRVNSRRFARAMSLDVLDVRVVDAHDGTRDGDGEGGDGARRELEARGFFGTNIAHWCGLASGGEVRARVRVARDDGECAMDAMRFEAQFVCDIASAREVVRLVTKDGLVAPTRSERVDRVEDDNDDADGGVCYDLICAFDGIDVSDVPTHTTMNVGAFEVVVRDGEGAERARAAALARVEQDDAGVLRRFVLPYKAVFE